MSKPAGNAETAERAAFARLEAVVGELIGRLSDVSARATEADEKSVELTEIVRRFTGDDASAGRLLSRLEALEADNSDLRRRLGEGRAGIDRLLAKIRFLEDQR